MVARRFKVLKEKIVADNANIDPVFQTKAQNCEEAVLEDEKRGITEMSEELDNDLSLRNEDHEEYHGNMGV
eukprot:7699794-Ditylum_brightwellii.AAC.1